MLYWQFYSEQKKLHQQSKIKLNFSLGQALCVLWVAGSHPTNPKHTEKRACPRLARLDVSIFWFHLFPSQIQRFRYNVSFTAFKWLRWICQLNSTSLLSEHSYVLLPTKAWLKFSGTYDLRCTFIPYTLNFRNLGAIVLWLRLLAHNNHHNNTHHEVTATKICENLHSAHSEHYPSA